MTARRRQSDKQRPLYMISIAAELAGMHPQTLRIYERKRLIQPRRSAGNTRLYSEADIERLRLIQHLTKVEGINLAGVERILELEREAERLRDEAERLRLKVEQARSAAAKAIRTPEYTADIVMVRRGTLARRS